MDVVALLPRHLQTHLTIVLGSQHSLIPAGGWDTLLETVVQQVTDVLVVDPMVGGWARTDVIAQIHQHLPSLPIVLYTTMSGASMRAILELGRLGIEHVVLNRYDDERRRFLDLLERVPAQALSDQVLQLLEPELSRLPVALIRAVELLFRSPSRFRNAQDLAAAAGLQVRTMYRRLESAGIRSPRLFVAAARLLRAYALMRDPGRQIKHVASRVGYHSQYQLTQHMRALTGYTPRVARRTMEPVVFVRLLADGVRQSVKRSGARGRSGP